MKDKAQIKNTELQTTDTEPQPDLCLHVYPCFSIFLMTIDVFENRTLCIIYDQNNFTNCDVIIISSNCLMLLKNMCSDEL